MSTIGHPGLKALFKEIDDVVNNPAEIAAYVPDVKCLVLHTIRQAAEKGKVICDMDAVWNVALTIFVAQGVYLTNLETALNENDRLRKQLKALDDDAKRRLPDRM